MEKPPLLTNADDSNKLSNIKPMIEEGWYPCPETGKLRHWDGSTWGIYAPPTTSPQPQIVKIKHERTEKFNKIPVTYTREQKGHSILLHLLLGWIVLWIPAIYYTLSPNHYWRL